MGQTPEPSWTKISSDGPVDIRRYDPLIAAEVTVTGERYSAINDGFRILADYIFGNNEPAQKIAMTAPVTQQADNSKADSTKIAMTAPVTQQAAGGDNGSWSVRFVMPAEYTIDTLPRPRDPRIKIIQEPAHKVAAIRFSGFNSDSNLQKHQKILTDWLTAQKLKPVGDPVYAFYNPPWTPPFLKRNEIMVRID